MLEILKILIFTRPFISSLAFYKINLIFSLITSVFLLFWSVSKRFSIKRIKPLSVPLGLFVIALIVSLAFSVDQTKSLSQIYNYLIYILIFLVVASLSTPDKQKVIRTIIFSGFIISLLAIYQYFFGFKHVLDYMAKYKITYVFATDYIMRKRIFFPFVTPNTLAGFLVLIIPLTLGRTRFYLFLVPISFALLLTQSIGSFLSLLVGIIIYLSIKNKKISYKKFIALGILVLIIIFVIILRAQTTQEYLKPYFSLGRRLDYWQQTLRMIKVHPLTGLGLGNFNLVLSRYAHNIFLQIWAEMGVLAIFGFIWFIVAHLKYILTNIRMHPDKNQIAALLTANITFLTHNLVDFTFFLPEICFLWWVVLGLSMDRDE